MLIDNSRHKPIRILIIQQLYSFFYKNYLNWSLALLFLKLSCFLGYIVLNLLFFCLFLYSLFFLIFHNTVLMLILVQSVKNHGTKITYTSQFFLMSCSRHFVLMFCGTANLTLFLACSQLFLPELRLLLL